MPLTSPTDGSQCVTAPDQYARFGSAPDTELCPGNGDERRRQVARNRTCPFTWSVSVLAPSSRPAPSVTSKGLGEEIEPNEVTGLSVLPASNVCNSGDGAAATNLVGL